MKIEELAAELGITSRTIYEHWKRTQEQYMRYGIKLERVGRGKNVNYGIGYGEGEIRW